MEWTISGEDLFVRIDPGEEIHASLQALADQIGIDAAAITSGIGRTRENTYGFMNAEGVYITKSLNSPGELISLSGNISRTEDEKPFTHIHCCWSVRQNIIGPGMCYVGRRDHQTHPQYC